MLTDCLEPLEYCFADVMSCANFVGRMIRDVERDGCVGMTGRKGLIYLSFALMRLE